MIPKIIHYCWFGRGKMPEQAEHCLASWRKFLPDYELKLWNEDSFDVNRLRFTRQAYERRKFAFVTDYVRLYALKSFGGIYMDTDVEVLRSLDDLLGLPGFTGFESNCLLPTGLLASRKGAPWLDMLMSYYDGKPFVRWYGRLNDTPNTLIISKIFRRRGIRLDNTYQVYDGELHFFPKDYFCPKTYETGQLELTENSYCIHHFAGSWK